MVDIRERRLGEHAQRLVLDDDELVLAGAFDPHALAAELAVGRGVGAEWEQRRVLVGRGDLGMDTHGRTILLGSFPRKREPIFQRRWLWVPAFAGTTGLCLWRTPAMAA